MNAGRIATALVLSIGLHLTGIFLLRARLTSPEPRNGSPESSEVPVTVLGAGAPLGRGQAAERAAVRAAYERSSGAGKTNGTHRSEAAAGRDAALAAVAPDRAVLAVVIPEGPASDTAMPAGSGPGSGSPLGSATSPGKGDGMVGANLGIEAAGGGGSALTPGIDLKPFVERLRRSAEQCGALSQRSRTDRRSRASVGLVRFCVTSEGTPTSVSLVESSGDPALDRSAIECIVPGAAPLPPADRCLVVPLRFH